MGRMVAWTSGALLCPLPVTLAAVLARDASHLSVISVLVREMS